MKKDNEAQYEEDDVPTPLRVRKHSLCQKTVIRRNWKEPRRLSIPFCPLPFEAEPLRLPSPRRRIIDSRGKDHLPQDELRRLSTKVWTAWKIHVKSLGRRRSGVFRPKSSDGYTKSTLSPRERFRKAGRQVKFMCGVQLSLNKCAEEAGKGMFSVQIADLLEKMSRTPSVVYYPENSNEKLTFNATDFRSKYEFTWPMKARLVLSKRPSDRTEDDIRLVRSLMRGLYSFRKYSKNLQDLICRVIRYAKYGRRRVVVRKGHPGFSFYFIFSGMVGVTLEEDEMHAFVKKEVNLLKKGASFGEIALLKESRRKATVVCLEDTEFLVVDADDFFDNNLHLHIKKDFEYRLDFLSQLDMFSTWCKDDLEELSDMGRIEEYCNESLIVKDARDSEWLLIVTKGRADVLKLVDLAQLYLAKQPEEEELIQVSRKNRVLSGRTVNIWSDDIASRFMQPPQKQQQQLQQQQQQQFPWLCSGDGEDQHRKSGPDSNRPARPKTTGQITSRTRTTGDDAESAQRRVRSKSATVRIKVPDDDDDDDDDNDEDDVEDELQGNGITISHSRSDGASQKQTVSEPTVGENCWPSHISLGMDTIKAPGVEAGVYIQVDALRPGDLFGIQGIQGRMPHLSVVSHGCELIRISMSKFREFADDATFEKVKKLIPTYASDLTLWRGFQKKNKWNNFKDGVITDVMRHAHMVASHASSRDGRRGRKVSFQKSVTSDWVTNTWSRQRSDGENTGPRTTPLPKIPTTTNEEKGATQKSPRPRRRAKSGVPRATSTRPGSRATNRPQSTRVSESRPQTRQSMSSHDLKVLENRRASIPASRFFSASHSLIQIHQSPSRVQSAVGGALSVGGGGGVTGERRFNSQTHLHIPDLASVTKPTYTSSRSWRELKS